MGEGKYAVVNCHAFFAVAALTNELFHLVIGQFASSGVLDRIIHVLNLHIGIVSAQLKNNVIFRRTKLGGCGHEGLRGNQGVGVVVKAVIRFLHIISLSGL